MLIVLVSSFIQVPLRCIVIWSINFGGVVWRETSVVLFLVVTRVSILKLSISVPQVFCNYCWFPVGNGKKLLWTFNRFANDNITSCGVVVDRFTKLAHYILFCSTCSRRVLGELYLEHVIRLHGVPLNIVLDRDTCFNTIPFSIRK